MKRAHRPEWQVWLALLVLLALTAGSSWLKLGAWNAAINDIIAVCKATLVVWFYMGLARHGGAVRVAAGVGLVGLTLLFVLSGADYATRAWWPAPWQVPPTQMLRGAPSR